MDAAITQRYSYRNPNRDSRSDVTSMAVRIQSVMKQLVETARWMDGPTRREALKKIKKFSYSIGSNSRTSRKLGVNGFYEPGRNRIVITSGMLQSQYYDFDGPAYMNYAGVGSVIGHEIIHGFDTQGSRRDGDGRRRNWWSSATKGNYQKKAQCLVDQYSRFRMPGSIRINGHKTINENIADNVGFKLSRLAYKQSERQMGKEPPLPGLEKYTNDQMYWLSFGCMRCVKSESIGGEHSPKMARVNVPLSNMAEFARDWQCPAGSKMNPNKKCSIW